VQGLAVPGYSLAHRCGVDGVVSALLPLEERCGLRGRSWRSPKAVVEECSPPTSETTGAPRPGGSDSPVASTPVLTPAAVLVMR
jgi:hypothetical protein